MYPYMNEDAAWQRLIDLQREAENARLWAPATGRLVAWVARPLTWVIEVVWLAVRPLPRMPAGLRCAQTIRCRRLATQLEKRKLGGAEMNPYANEDAAWQRLQDMQRERENRSLWSDGAPSPLDVAEHLVMRAWHLAGLAARRAPRYRPGVLDPDGGNRLNHRDVA
jgi:hypothetical protein